MREPDAITMVRNGYLAIGVQRLTRFHDRSQILDNAKHVLFSTRHFAVPEPGGISFGLRMRVRRRGALPDDLYDGYGSFLCLDFSSGTAMDWFLAEDRAAAVFARLPFPGVEVPDDGDFRYWAIFKEIDLSPTADGFHDISIEIGGSGEVVWRADGQEVSRQEVRAPMGDLTLGLAIMTEKDLGPVGSTSLHGQGIFAEWSPVEIETSSLSS